MRCGYLQIICGVVSVTLATGITYFKSNGLFEPNLHYYGLPLWGQLFAVIAGCFGVYSPQKKCLLIGCLIFSVLAVAVVLVLIILAIIGLSDDSVCFDPDDEAEICYGSFRARITMVNLYGRIVLNSLIILVSTIEIIVAFVQSRICWNALRHGKYGQEREQENAALSGAQNIHIHVHKSIALVDPTSLSCQKEDDPHQLQNERSPREIHGF